MGSFHLTRRDEPFPATAPHHMTIVYGVSCAITLKSFLSQGNRNRKLKRHSFLIAIDCKLRTVNSQRKRFFFSFANRRLLLKIGSALPIQAEERTRWTSTTKLQLKWIVFLSSTRKIFVYISHSWLSFKKLDYEMTMNVLDFSCISKTPRFRDRLAQSLRSLADRSDTSAENVHMGHMLLDDHTEGTRDSSLPTNIMHTDWPVFRCPCCSSSLEIVPSWLRLTTSQNPSHSIHCYLTSSGCLVMTPPSFHR